MWGGVVGGASSREARTVDVEGRAPTERTANMLFMSVTLDVSKLSGWLNADARCRVEREIIGGGATCGQAGKRVEWDGCWRKRQGGPNCGGSGQGTRGAHVKHVLHVCDAGRVEAQRLVERGRALPSRKGKHRRSGDVRASRRGFWVGWGAQAAGRPRLWRLRACAERTSNMYRMSVTLDVSQLDMSALNWVKREKSPFIFVTAETPQLEIGPYVAVAESASAL